MKVRVSTEWDGKRRKLYAHQCKICNTEFFAPKHRRSKYCSKDCFYVGSRTRVEIVCVECGQGCFKTLSKIKNSVHGKHFCSRTCKDRGQSLDGKCPEIRPGHYKTGEASYRRRALREHGAICNVCGYDEIERMLDVHHKDKNREHNQISNLEVLCVWCHALITRNILGPSPN